jgi:hypothetical protein
MGGYTRVVSGQPLGKHVLTATDTNARIEDFSMWSVPRYYKQGTRLELVSSVWESVKRGLEPGGRGIAIVVAVTRKRLATE